MVISEYRMKLIAPNHLLTPLEIESLGNLKPFYLELLKQQKLSLKLEQFQKSEDVSIGVFILSVNGNFIDVSYELAEIMGYEVETLKTLQIRDLIYLSDRPSYDLAVNRLINDETSEEVLRLNCLTHDQELISLEISLFKVIPKLKQKTSKNIKQKANSKKSLEQPKEPLYLIAKFEDRTVGDRLEKLIHQSQELCWQFFNENPQPCLIFDANSFITVNNAATYKYGYDQSEFLTKKISEIFLNIPNLVQNFDQHLKKNGQIIDVEVRGHDLMGDRLPMRIVSVRDITEENRTQRTLEALREAEENYRSIFENAVEGIFQTSESGQYLRVNPMLASIYGYESPEDLMNGVTDIGNQLYVQPQRRLEFMDLLKRQDAVLGFESEIFRKDGSIVWISENVRAVRGDQGQILRYEGTVVDITEIKRSEAALRLSEERFRLTFNYAPIGMVISALSGDLLQVNQAICAILGYTDVELLKLKCADITHPEDLDLCQEMRLRLLNGEFPQYQISKRYIRQDQKIVDALLHVSLTRNANGEPIHFIDQVEDISDRKIAEARIAHLAFHDALTGLPNRALFSDRLNQALSLARRTYQTQPDQQVILAVMFIDLDRFKHINDSLGHAIGDRLLQEVSQRFSQNVRKSDTIARMGGDEFIFLLPEIKQVEDAVKVADKILKCLSQPFSIDAHQLHITASIGICLYPHDGEDGEALLKNADVAMYRAKEQGRNHYQIFTQSMHDRNFEWMIMETAIRKAIAQTEFEVYYQPQVDLASGKVISMEALIRWQSESGFIAPDKFIPIAEEYGLIIPIGEWVLLTACTQNKLWQSMGLPPVQVSVNVSAKQFQDPQLLAKIQQILQDTNLAPQFLEIEITESAIMKDENAGVNLLKQLQNMGVHLSIDDFGKGYSSLTHLKKFPIQKLKIDASFIREVPANLDDSAITSTVVAIAHTLNLKAIAEGVETTAQLNFLRSLKCDAIQGYIFSPAVPAATATQILYDQRHF